MNSDVAGDLPERADVDPGRSHVDDEVRDAVVLRDVRVGAGQADPDVGPGHEDVQTFWPLSTQPPSARVARVVSAARSLPAPGSLKSWHQRISPAQRRGHQPLLLGRRAVDDQRRNAHAADVRPAAGGSRRLEELVDDELLDRTGVAPVRRGPVREEEAAVRRAAAAGRRGGRRHLGDDRFELDPERSGDGLGQLDAERPAGAADRLPGGRDAPGAGPAEQLARWSRPGGGRGGRRAPT